MTLANTPYRLGWHRDPYDPRDVPFVPQITTLAALPSKVDLAIPFSAFDQGNCGSCTSQAIAAAFRYSVLHQGLADFLPSRLFIYYYERLAEGTVSEDASAAIRDGIKVVNGRGVCPESEWPYDIAKFADAPPLQCSVDALKDRVVKYRRIRQTLPLMQACLASSTPFVFGVDVFPSFMNAQNGNIPMPGPGESLLGGHALLCTGYDDATQRFTFLNSWGNWGRNGFGTIPYAYLESTQLAADFWEIEAVGSTLAMLIEEFKALL